mgnify:FL=1
MSRNDSIESIKSFNLKYRVYPTDIKVDTSICVKVIVHDKLYATQFEDIIQLIEESIDGKT